MRTLPAYKNPVSLIPGGCPQFLDFRLEKAAIGRIRRYFREDRAESGARAVLRCLAPTEDGRFLDMVSGEAGDYDYELDARRILDDWLDLWLPLPVPRLRGQKWPDGGERFEYGPSNWARGRLMPADDDPEALHLTLVFDMTVEDPPVDNAENDAPDLPVVAALTPEAVAAHATFRLAAHVRDNAWFLNLAWVDEWLAALWEKRAGKRRRDDGRELEYLASYLTLLDVLRLATGDITMRVVNPARDNPVDVDLVLDIGNSRTTGILVETLPQRVTNLNDSYLLQLRDLDQPQKIHTEPFETRVEFAEASFGNEALSRRSGRRTPAFAWPSAARVGPEAVRLSALAVNAEGTTGMSSPKRYLWDERPWRQSWRSNTGGGPEPLVTRGPLARRVNEEGTPLSCLDLPEARRNPNLRAQSREAAFESLFTRSSLMLFMMAEILLQALTTINSPGQRCRMELPDVPRRLRRVVFTVPPGMPVAEHRIYRRWVNFAARVLWDALGWSDAWQDGHGPRADYRANPQIRCNWDEATCTQLVYLYNELTRKFQGDAYHLFRLMGRQRDDSGKPSLRVATIDIGGGTTDLSITTFFLDNEEGASARIRPRQEFRDGFTIAGDDIVKEVINSHILPALGEAVAGADTSAKNRLLGQLCGRELMENSQLKRNRRAQFVRQAAVPAALGLLEVYERTDLTAGPGEVACRMRDFFLPPTGENEEAPAGPVPHSRSGNAAESGPNKEPEGESSGTPDTGSGATAALPLSLSRRPHPGRNAVAHAEETAREIVPGSDFRLMDMPIRISPRLVDATVRDVLHDVLSDLCEVVQAYDCDVLLLTGRPSRWPGVLSSVLAASPLPPSRIVPMSAFKVGSWYPFSDSLGNITDPKTTVVVGAILCALAEARLEGFSFDAGSLTPRSTACFIGEMDIAGQIRTNSVWFHVDVDDTGRQELVKRDVQLNGPIAVGFRQLEAERWPTSRFYYVDFTSEEARRRAAGRLPYTLSLTFAVSEDNDENRPDEERRDEGTLIIEDITARFSDAVRSADVEARLQTLPGDEGHWLDSGIVYRAV